VRGSAGNLALPFPQEETGEMEMAIASGCALCKLLVLAY
jgi:hypothetical protein